MRHNLQRHLKLPGRTWFASAFLVLLICAAAVGVLFGISPAILIAVTAIALIIWESAGQNVYRRRDTVLPSDDFRKWTHTKLLVSSVGIGLLLAEAGLRVQLPLPFGMVILSILLVLFAFFRFFRLLAHG